MRLPVILRVIIYITTNAPSGLGRGIVCHGGYEILSGVNTIDTRKSADADQSQGIYLLSGSKYGAVFDSSNTTIDVDKAAGVAANENTYFRNSGYLIINKYGSGNGHTAAIETTGAEIANWGNTTLNLLSGVENPVGVSVLPQQTKDAAYNKDGLCNIYGDFTVNAAQANAVGIKLLSTDTSLTKAQCNIFSDTSTSSNGCLNCNFAKGGTGVSIDGKKSQERFWGKETVAADNAVGVHVSNGGTFISGGSHITETPWNKTRFAGGTITMNGNNTEGILAEGRDTAIGLYMGEIMTNATSGNGRGLHIKDKAVATLEGVSIDTSASTADTEAQAILVDNATLAQTGAASHFRVNKSAGLEVIHGGMAGINADMTIDKLGTGTAGVLAKGGTVSMDGHSLTLNATAGSTCVVGVESGATTDASTFKGSAKLLLNGAGGNTGLRVDGNQASAALDDLAITSSVTDSTGIYCKNGSTMNVTGLTAVTGAATGVKADTKSSVNMSATAIDAQTALEVGSGYAAINVNAAGGSDVDIKGNLLGSGTSAGSTMNVNMDTAASLLTGTAMANNQTINMKVANGAIWNVTGDSSVTDLTNDADGLINMRANSTNAGQTFETLSTKQYHGNGGTLVMDTDLASQTHGDKLAITGSSSGTSYIQVYDAGLLTGQEVMGTKHLLLVSGAGTGTSFVGKNLDAGGLWETTPTITKGTETFDANGNVIGTADQWYLEQLVRSANKDTSALLAEMDSKYGFWRMTSDTVRQRLGDLRNDAIPEPDGNNLWARYRGGRYSGDGLSNSYNMLQIGYDKHITPYSAVGFAGEMGKSSGGYDYGYGKDTMTDFTMYGTWYSKNGAYTDVVGRMGFLDTDVDTHGFYPETGDGREYAYSLSVEHGKTIQLDKKGTFVKPQAQLILGRMNGSSYTTSAGTSVREEALNSAVGRIGVVLGKNFRNNNDFYIKANIFREFSGRRDISLSAANGESMNRTLDYGDTWYELGFGLNLDLNKTTHFYADVERSFGASICKELQINAGLRFEY